MDVQGQDSEEPVKKSRGGCGAQQPKLTIEGMKMIAEYKASRKKNDEEPLPEPVERKQQLSAERVSLLKVLSVQFLNSLTTLFSFLYVTFSSFEILYHQYLTLIYLAFRFLVFSSGLVMRTACF